MKALMCSRVDIGRGPLILVNRDHPLANEEMPALREVAPDIELEQRAAAFFDQLCEKTGGGVVSVSGYRSRDEQKALYRGSLRDNGPDFTRQYVALPGCSEHETGLAIDVGLSDEYRDPLCPHFPYDGIGGLFRRHAPECGFIERYPQGKEHITGIAHEPWHFRYVGYPHARLITDSGLTLEEYLTELRRYPYGGAPLRVKLRGLTFSIAYLPAHEDIALALHERANMSVSGDNADGFILTSWRCNA